MGAIEKPNTFSAGAIVFSTEHNSNFDTIYNEFNGGIDGANVDSITTASKVSGASLFSLANIPSGAGVIPAANIPVTFPTGGIIMWSGAVSAIPAGWVICDGANSTPDLTDKFVIHADADSGGTHDVGDTGGAHSYDIEHTHTGPAHTHTLDTNSSNANATANDFVGWTAADPTLRGYDPDSEGGLTSVFAEKSTDSQGTGATGNGGSATQATIPKFYALAFIMKT